MSWTLFIGFFGMLAVLGLSLEGSLDVYMQYHSILIVVGGTLAIIFFSVPGRGIRNILIGLKEMVYSSSHHSIDSYRHDIVELSKTKALLKQSGHPLINYAAQLWEMGIDNDLFVALLSQKRNDLIAEKSDAVHALKNLAKYPPALGMMGTVMGMVALFKNLDSQANSVGESLALAMTATFFGLFIANALLNPLADRLHVKQVRYKRLCLNLYELLLLVNGDEPVDLIEDEVSQRAG
ncbi:MAG: MotA/TolQ/ExbB proton channel family protein [Bdellovibrionales bacterium]|nr:MotA/TolQ/ExbB proton channel family protein [Bdellovibrionales bacterium]